MNIVIHQMKTVNNNKGCKITIMQLISFPDCFFRKNACNVISINNMMAIEIGR